MKLTKIKGYIGIYDMTPDDIGCLLKFQIPLAITFFDFENKKFHKEKLNLGLRTGRFGIHEIENTQQLSVDGIVSYITEMLTDYPELTLMFLIQTKDYNNKKPLFELIGKIKPEIYQSCVFIDYQKDGDIFKIENLDNTDGTPEKFIYYNSNDTYLIFDSSGPKLVTDDAKVNSILDLVQ